MSDHFELAETGLKLRYSARLIAEETAAPNAAEVDEQARFPQEAVRQLAAEGFFGLCLPEELGGKEQPPRVFAAIVEELAKACPSTAMIYVMHVAASQAMAASSQLADRPTILRDVAAGMKLATLALSERGSRSQFWAPVSKLETNGEGYLVTACKSWVTSASEADLFVASAQQPHAESPLQSTLYLFRRDAPGVRVNGTFNGLGLRGNDSAPVLLERLHVGRRDLLTRQGEGTSLMLEVVLPWFAVGTSAMANGICVAAVAQTVQHLSGAGFEHEDRQLRDLPNLRARVAEMSARTEQSRALLAKAAAAMEAPDEHTPLWVLQARLSALQAAVDVTDLAMQTCGGAAFSKHLALERFFRDARAGWVMAPTVDHLHDFIGRALTGLPLF